MRNLLAYKRGYSAGYNRESPDVPNYAPGYESGREEWIAGYRDGWRLTDASPTEPPI